MKTSNFRNAALTCAVLSIAGCSSINNLLSDRADIDYKSAAKNPNAGLEVPPDLTQLAKDTRYSVPQGNQTTSFSTYSVEQGERKAIGSGPDVLPSNAEIRVERAGSQRWLVVNQPPEKVFPMVKEFWQDLGFLVVTELPEAGIIETDWAENRAKVPQDFVRNALGKVLDSLYSTGERDKFRTRLERTANGTEIYISHRGLQEVFTGATKEQTIWTARNPDPELEAEFLRRMMVRLGSDAEKAKAIIASTPPAPPKAQIAGDTVTVQEPFDRAWRRVGLALDRVGFTVEDRDRQQGLYFVRYVDPNADAQGGEKKGFLGRLFSFGGSNHAKAAAQYRVALKSFGESTQISVQAKDGAADSTNTSNRILGLLHEQLQ